MNALEGKVFRSRSNDSELYGVESEGDAESDKSEAQLLMMNKNQDSKSFKDDESPNRSRYQSAHRLPGNSSKPGSKMGSNFSR